MAALSITIAGVEFQNPVFVASGTFGYGQEASELVDVNQLGAIVTKSITPEVRIGNPQPRIAELPAGMLNSIGLANVGLERFIAEKLPFLQKLRTRVIVNVAGKTEDEFVQVVERLESEEGIAGYELNYSCPNVSEGGLEFSQNPAITERLTRRIRDLTRRLLITKLTPNITDIRVIARAAEQGGADAVSLINTVQGMAIDMATFRPRINTVIGGYSGPAIKPIALAKVFQARQAMAIPIIGIGGITTWEDAVEFFLAGATAVQVGTANFIDPRTGVHIAERLERFLQERGLESIDELIGAMKA
ncbi:MAG: dihydroorotate dehydrogenase [candidate division KSB1 bacterium]|nr:dihydroorotate dehydrogenase [candidate division KSB1 bacterium]